MSMNLSNSCKILEHIPTTATGTTTINGNTVDMAGFDSVLFIIKYSTAANNNTLKAQQGQASNMSDAADLAGTSVTVGASDEIVWIDLHRPQERYVRAAALRGTTTVIEWAVAIQYNAHAAKLPISNALAGTIAGELWISPAEGTA
jgi:hypothetical protein